MNSSNGIILKNTGLLYFRLIFLTFINLYTVRITLEALGQVDYGVFDVIASVVASLSVLTGAMTSATQRFLSYHLGRNDYREYCRTFTMLLVTFIVMAMLLVIVGECIGCFFIEDWLTIPQKRISAAYWVYQMALLSFAFGFVSIPYTSQIIANERMGAFAGFSVIEGLLKLGVACWLVAWTGDRLILYGILTAVISIVIFIMTIYYCHSRFRFFTYIWQWNKGIFMQLSKYTGWNLFGSVSGMLATQGQNVLLNIFFGPVINTAKAIADRIQHVVYGFSINLYMAVSPQIIKSYAAEDYERALNLVQKTSKMSFLLIFVLAFPLICNMDGLLDFWLGADSVTQDMKSFSKLILVYCMILSLEPPISRIIQATGNIRNYQLFVGAITLSFIPIAAVVLYFGAGAVFTLVVLMFVMAIAQVVRVVVAHHQVNLGYGTYFRIVIKPLLRVCVVGVPMYFVFVEYDFDAGFPMLVISTLLSAICGLFIAGILGLDKSDRTMIGGFVKNKLMR